MTKNVEEYSSIRELSAARMYVNLRFPFCASLLANLQIRFTDKVSTAAVTPKGNLFINAKFFHSLNVQERAFLLCHEVLHVAFGIFWRGKNHHPYVSNIAHDFVINMILNDHDDAWTPKSILLSEKYRGMPYEEVYYTIFEQYEELIDWIDKLVKKWERGELPSGKWGIDVYRDGVPDEDSVNSEDVINIDLEALWTSRVRQATMRQGTLKGSLKEAVEGILQPKIDWRSVLQRKIQDAVDSFKLNWANPGRRYCATDVYCPSENSECFDGYVYVDTSGSISSEQLERATAEISQIIEDCGGRVRLLYGDVGITFDEEITEIPRNYRGRGGTCFKELFDKLQETEKVPCLICFTDTMGSMPDYVPDFPVFWAVYEDCFHFQKEMPFGEIVNIPL